MSRAASKTVAIAESPGTYRSREDGDRSEFSLRMTEDAESMKSMGDEAL